ncbi:MAG: hypothetical protein WDO16_14770 [Bacteroidota bacterium]
MALQLVYNHRISRLNESSESYYPGSSYDTPPWKMRDFSFAMVFSMCDLFDMLFPQH